jgi:hypothetical protein
MGAGSPACRQAGVGVEYNFPPPPHPLPPREGRFLVKGVMSTHRVVGEMQRPFQFYTFSKFKGGKK